MKLDIKSTAIYAFAAFAAWFAYRQIRAGGASAKTGGVFDMLKDGRKSVGAATQQNNSQLTQVMDGTGWTYWDDGQFTYGMSPSGQYYINGEAVV